MRSILRLAVLTASLSPFGLGPFGLGDVVLAQANDELFSELAMESVFEKTGISVSSETVAKPAESTSAERITGVSGLTQILKGAELEHRVEGDRVQMKFEDSGWEFPLTLKVDLERERILCDLSLVEIKKPESVDREAVLRLMAAGDPAQAAFFAFDPSEKLIQLRASLSSRNVTAAGLRADWRRLAQLADRQSKLWSG